MATIQKALVSMALLFLWFQSPVIAAGIHPCQFEAPSSIARPSPPSPVDFHLAMVKHPNENGVFKGSIFIKSRLSDVPVKLILNPTEGIEVLKAPAKLRGWLRKDKPVIINIVARIAPTAPRPAGLNVELRLRYPTRIAKSFLFKMPYIQKVKLGNQRHTLKLLQEWSAMPKGGPIVKLDRSFFFPKER